MSDVSDRDYKLLKLLEHGARSRSALGGSDPEIAARLTRLLELGLIVSDVDYDMIRETKFELTAEGRAYIQDHKDETVKKHFNGLVLVIIIPIILLLIGAFFTSLFETKSV